MATKKKCAACNRVGKQVVARESNSSATKRDGGRRCICRHGRGKTKADARKAVA